MTSTKPNILMLLVDEMRADALGCFGNPVINTPNLDRLAANGTCFEQCMVTQPTCTPSRASLLTGCFPSALRSRMVGCETPDDDRFLPRVLRDAGYDTASIGKIHLIPQGYEPEAIEKSRCSDGTYDFYGFQYIDLVNGHGDRCFGPGYTAWLKEKVPDVDACRKTAEPLCNVPRCYRWPFPPEVHSSQYVADRSVAYLKKAAQSSVHCP